MKFLAIVIFLFSTTAFANHHEGDGPCAKDRETYCAAAKGDHAAVMKCMQENEAKLSAECKAHHATMKEHMKDVHEACHGDAETLCPGKKGHEIKKCLSENKDKLSAECKTEWKEMKDAKKAAKKGAH